MCVLINLHPMSILSAGGGSFPMKSTKSDRLGIKIKEKQAYKKIAFESIKSQIPFNMFCHISENDKNSSKVSIEINMELNFMMKMLVQKPINIFLDRFTEIIKKV